MRRHGFSQLAVKEGKSVLGLFSYRAFALEVARTGDRQADPAASPVEEFLEREKPAYARLSDEFREMIDVLDERTR